MKKKEYGVICVDAGMLFVLKHAAAPIGYRKGQERSPTRTVCMIELKE